MPTNMPPLVDEVINLMEACQGLGANAEECYEDVVYTLHYRIAHYNLDERSLLPAIQSYYSNGSLSAIHTWAGANGGSTQHSSPFGPTDPEEQVDVGEEYELLKDGDIVQVGDEWWSSSRSKWTVILDVYGPIVMDKHMSPFRRKKVVAPAGNGSLSAIHTWAGNGGSTWYSSPFGTPATEEEVDVGEEYELLKEGDAIQVGDELWLPSLSSWSPIKQVTPDERNIAYPFLVRRKKGVTPAVPQKWTCGHGVDPGDTSCVVCRNWSGRIVDTKRT